MRKVDEFTINLFRKPTKAKPIKIKLFKKKTLTGKFILIMSNNKLRKVESVRNSIRRFLIKVVDNEWFEFMPYIHWFLVRRKRAAENYDKVSRENRLKYGFYSMMLSDYNEEYYVENILAGNPKMNKNKNILLTPNLLFDDLKNGNLNTTDRGCWLKQNILTPQNLITTNYSLLEAQKLIKLSLETSKHSCRDIWTPTFYLDEKKNTLLNYPLISVNNNQGYNFFEEIKENHEFYSKHFIYLTNYSDLNILLKVFKFQNNIKIDFKNLPKSIDVHENYILIKLDNEFLNTYSLVLFQNTNNIKTIRFFSK